MIDENKKNGNEYTVFYIYKEIKKKINTDSFTLNNTIIDKIVIS